MSTEILQNLYDEDANQQHKLGELYQDPFGRRFRYVQAGASALVTGELLQEAAEVTNFRSMVVQAAVAIGATKIPLTLGGTAVTANQFESGDLVVESSTGIGQAFKITRHDVQTSTTGTCNFYVDRAVKIALTTSSQVSVRKNSYDGVIQYPITTQTGGAVGFALYAMTASYYGWVQSGGDGAVLQDTGTNSSNGLTALVPSAAVAGSVKLFGADGARIVAYSREVVTVDSTMGFAHIVID